LFNHQPHLDIRTWHSNIEQHASEGVNKILIGNKCDWVDKKTVTEEQGRALADEFGIRFMETSAKANEGVEEAFFTLARLVAVQPALTSPIHYLITRPVLRDIKTRLIDSQPDTSAGSTSATGATKESVNVGQTSNQNNNGCC
jgi:Ras-related protein Rab-8A